MEMDELQTKMRIYEGVRRKIPALPTGLIMIHVLHFILIFFFLFFFKKMWNQLLNVLLFFCQYFSISSTDMTFEMNINP